MTALPLHSFKVRDDLWDAAKARAKQEGTSLGAVLTGLLDSYVYGPGNGLALDDPQAQTSTGELEALRQTADRIADARVAAPAPAEPQASEPSPAAAGACRHKFTITGTSGGQRWSQCRACGQNLGDEEDQS